MQSQYVESSPGSVSQIRECAAEFQKFAKETHTPVFLIGHITKDGSIAGPKILEHMVDTVLQFEGDRNYAYRILRTLKNRFGSSSELGIYEMTGEGMRQVSNPSEILITQKEEQFERRSDCRNYGRNKAVAHRSAGVGNPKCIWYAATNQYRL